MSGLKILSYDGGSMLLSIEATETTALEGTLLPNDEILFFVGPVVPGTDAREVTASWKMSMNAEVEVKAGSKMRIDSRSGANYYRKTVWSGRIPRSLKPAFKDPSAIKGPSK